MGKLAKIRLYFLLISMWRFVREVILSVLINAFILYGLNYYKFGIEILIKDDGDLRGLRAYLILGAIFWIVNFILRKIVHVVSWPLKLLTFGIISVVINVGMLYLFQWFVNTNYGDIAMVAISPDYLKAFILSIVITFAYRLLSKILK